MARIIHYWLDSGANIHSKRRGSIPLSDLCITDEEWDAMTDEARDEAVKDIAFEGLEWGFDVKEEGESDDA